MSPVLIILSVVIFVAVAIVVDTLMCLHRMRVNRVLIELEREAENGKEK